MFDLTRRERTVIIILVLALFAALGVIIYKKYNSGVDITVKSFSMKGMDDIIDKSMKININEAEIQNLTRLKGVGEKMAGRIIEYRTAKGRFSSITDIKNVKGIGQKLFEEIKDDITVE